MKSSLRAQYLAALVILIGLFRGTAVAAGDDPHIFTTYGVHNNAKPQACTYPTCVYSRAMGEPSDPRFPPYWTSRFAMYRIFNNYQQHPPPYDAPRMSGLRNGADYQLSWGTTYYDATWHGRLGAHAMEEHFEHFCLPTFPFPNNYSCSIISLDHWAFFVTYNDRPTWMPPVCLFSPDNSPPAPNFIRHLPYSKSDSARTGFALQAYSFWTGQDEKVDQTGASPDQTANGGILFGFAFYSRPTRDAPDAPPYRHPHSFYFSGFPPMPNINGPNAPMVSQNYVGFSVRKPPDDTWSEVANLDPTKLPRCSVFEGPPAPPDAHHFLTVRTAMGTMRVRH